MRTHLFTFTKTERVKVTSETEAISIDLTRAEAAESLFRLNDASSEQEDSGGTPEEALAEMVYELTEKLQSFVDGGK